MAEANRIKALYDQTVIPAMVKKFNYANVNQVPKLVKITINGGLGDCKDNAKSVQLVENVFAIPGIFDEIRFFQNG